MKRKYENDETADDVIYFVGTEIEHTNVVGQATLFKTGERPLAEILHYLGLAEEKISQEITHIYFTANHSLTQIKDWTVVSELLSRGYTVTVDGFIDDLEKVMDELTPHKNLIIMAAAPFDYEKFRQHNTYVKLDDRVPFFGTNPGVWVHPLSKLTDDDVYTSWDQYQVDEVLARKSDLDENN